MMAAGIARGLVDFAVSRGADRAALLARAGVRPEDLVDQDARLPILSYVTLMKAAQTLTADPALALHYGESVDMSEVSIVGLITNASETMMDAFNQMQRFGLLVMDRPPEQAGPRLVLHEPPGEMWMEDRRPTPNLFPEAGEEMFARLTCGPRRFLPRPHVLEVHFTHPAPPYRAEYDRIFQCPVVFDSRWNAMKMDASLGTHRVQLQPRYVFGVLSERAEQLLKSLETAKTVRARVEGALMPILHTGDVSMDLIAEKLGLSRQTLARRLKDEDVTYEQALDNLRHRMALHYLDGRKASINETAYLVGFSDPSAFSRAFKRWTGKSPRNRD